MWHLRYRCLCLCLWWEAFAAPRQRSNMIQIGNVIWHPSRKHSQTYISFRQRKHYGLQTFQTEDNLLRACNKYVPSQSLLYSFSLFLARFIKTKNGSYVMLKPCAHNVLRLQTNGIPCSGSYGNLWFIVDTNTRLPSSRLHILAFLHSAYSFLSRFHLTPITITVEISHRNTPHAEAAIVIST